jgi:hypothetical protein
MNSLKEMAIRDYISNVDFSGDWNFYKMKEDMRKFLGEEPGIEIVYKKDVMVNEVSGESKEFSSVNKIQIVFTDTNDKFRKIEFIVGDKI